MYSVVKWLIVGSAVGSSKLNSAQSGRVAKLRSGSSSNQNSYDLMRYSSVCRVYYGGLNGRIESLDGFI